MGWFSQKSEGSTAGRLLWYYQKLWYKLYIKHCTNKSRQNGKWANLHRTNDFNKKKTRGPNGTVITIVSWKAGSREVMPRSTGELFSFRLFGRKGGPKSPFLKPWESKMAQTKQLFITSWHWAPLKTVLWSGFEYTWKINENILETQWFLKVSNHWKVLEN